LIQTDRYLLACMAYIDLNPVRAGLVLRAQDYPWSSYGHYTGQRVDKLITPHALVWALGNTPFAREAAYAELVQGGINSVQQTALTDSTLQGWALGDADFVARFAKNYATSRDQKPGWTAAFHSKINYQIGLQPR
jgi:putative transposase